MKVDKSNNLIHRYLGLAVGLVVVALSLTGVLLRIAKTVCVFLGADNDNIFCNVLHDGHVSMWLPREISGLVLGYAMLLFSIILVTGVVMWLPYRKWKPMTWRGSRARLFNLHAILGMWCFPFVLYFCITGAICCLPWLRDVVGVDTFKALMVFHKGRFLGEAGCWLVALISVIIASLPLSGYLIWWRKRRIQKTSLGGRSKDSGEQK